MPNLHRLIKSYTEKNIVVRILIGMILGIALGLSAKYTNLEFEADLVNFAKLLGDLFISSLKSVAPILVFILVANSILSNNFSNSKGLKRVLFLYLLGTFFGGLTGVVFSYIFPVTLALNVPADLNFKNPGSLIVVLQNLLFNIVDNPIHALMNANYIGILAWAIILGIMLRNSNESTKHFFTDLAKAITKIVRIIIQFAPFGIFGLICISVYSTGLNVLSSYGKIILLLVSAMLFLALIINPIIVLFYLKKNPYPLVITCLRESGITAFFTRSSAANIPVNIALAKKLNLDEELYPISIPLGATINMGGASVVIAIMSISAAFSLGIHPDFTSAILLSLVATIGACGASGVAGGSLMLIPLACSLFGIGDDIAMQVVAIGFIIGVIQDSLETAINSSTDILFTAVASYTTNATTPTNTNI